MLGVKKEMSKLSVIITTLKLEKYPNLYGNVYHNNNSLNIRLISNIGYAAIAANSIRSLTNL